MKYVTQNGYIIIRRIEPERKVDGFKLADESEDGGVIWTAEVVAGSERYAGGTKVLFSRYMPSDFSDGRENLLVLKEDDVVAILQETGT